MCEICGAGHNTQRCDYLRVLPNQVQQDIRRDSVAETLAYSETPKQTFNQPTWRTKKA